MKYFNFLRRGGILAFFLLIISPFIFAASPPSTQPPGVTGGPFGNETQVGKFTVRDGKITAASNVNIVFPPQTDLTEAIAAISRAVNTLTSTEEDLAVIEQVPAGQYVISAKLIVSGGAATLIDCILAEETSPGSFAVYDQAFGTITDPPAGFFASGTTLSLLTVREDPSNIHLRCSTASGAPNAVVGNASLVMTKVGGLTCFGTALACQNPAP